MSYHSLVPKDWCIGTLWRHTPKAVKTGAPGNRVLAVVGIVEDQRKLYYLAWKCVLLNDGRLKHPAFKRPLYPEDRRLFRATSRNGSAPTATFRPDSHYTYFIPKD